VKPSFSSYSTSPLSLSLSPPSPASSKAEDAQSAFPFEIWSAIVGVLLCAYYVFAVPYVSSFLIRSEFVGTSYWPWVFGDNLLALFFMYETVQQYRMKGYFYYSGDEKHARSLRLHNVVVDLLAMIPFDLVLLSGNESMGNVVCWLRLNRLLCLCRMPRYTSCLNDFYEQLIHLSSAQSRIVWLFLLVIVLFHWFACLWHVVSFMSSAPTDGYLLSLYWSVTTLSTCGYGDIVPTTTPQTVYAFIVMVIGDVLCAAVVGSVTSLMLSIDASSGDFTRRLSLVKGYVQANQVSITSQLDIDTYFEYMWSKFRGVEETAILTNFPKSVKSNVVQFMMTDYLSHFPLFEPILGNEGLMMSIYDAITPQAYPPGMVICARDEIGKEMWFIFRGEVSIMVASTTVLPQRRISSSSQSFSVSSKRNSVDGMMNVKTLSEGDYFGENALVAVEKRMASCVAQTMVETFMLHRDSLERVFIKYPSTKTYFLKNAQLIRAKQLKDNENLQANMMKGKVSKSTGVSAMVEPKKGLKRIILPLSTVRFVWEIIALLGTFYTLLSIPLRILWLVHPTAPSSSRRTGVYILDYMIVDVFFWVDMYLKMFHFAYMDRRGNLVTEKKHIRANYFEGFFALDFVANLPLDFICLSAGLYSAATYFRGFRLLRVLLVPTRLNVIERHVKRTRSAMEGTLFRVGKFFVLLLTSFYVLACSWTYIGFYENKPESWISKDPRLNAIDRGDSFIFESLNRAIYFVIVSMTTHGSGDIVAKTTAEIMCAIVIMIVGMFTLPIIIGNLTAAAENLDTNMSTFENWARQCELFMELRYMPAKLKVKVSHYMDHLRCEQHGMLENKVEAAMPPLLWRNTQSGIHEARFLEQCAIFDGCQDAFVASLAHNIEMVLYPPKVTVCTKMQTCQKLRLVLKGRLKQTSGFGGLKVLQDEDIAEGYIIGIEKFVAGDRYPITLETETLCQFAVLQRKVMLSLIREYPEQQAILNGNTEKVTKVMEQQANSTISNLKSSKKLNNILNAAIVSDMKEESTTLRGKVIGYVRSGKLVVTPYSLKYCLWHVLIMCATIFNTLYIPMGIAFSKFLKDEYLLFAILSWLVDIVLVLDCVFNGFFFAFEYRGTIIKDPTEIWAHYKSERLLRDVMSLTIWLDLAALQTGLKFLPFLRIPRVFQMFRVLNCVAAIENYLRVAKSIFFPKSFRVLEMLIVVFLMTQIISCIWYICAYQDDSWTVRYNLTDASFYYQYVRSFYFSLGTMLVVFCGDIVPVTALETLTMVLVMIFGITVYAGFVANLATIFTDIDATFMQSYEKYQQMKQYLKFEEMPLSLQDGIMDYYNHLISRKKGMDEKKVFHSLPVFLREEIGFFLVGQHLRSTPVFKECVAEFVHHLCGALEPVFFTVQQFIFREGEIGDYMIFITNGRAEFVSKLLKDQDFVGEVGSGEFFGESALVTGPKPWIVSMRTLTFLESFILKCSNIEDCFVVYPEEKEKIYISRGFSKEEKVREDLLKKLREEVVQRKLLKNFSRRKHSVALHLSKLQCVNERYIPESKFRLSWDCISMTFLCLNMFLVPIQLAFVDKIEDFITGVALGYCSDLFFVFDMHLRMCHFVEISDGDAILDKAVRRKAYLDTWFWWDFAATVPLDVIVWIAHAIQSEKTEWLVRLAFFLRLAKLLRVAKWSLYQRSVEKFAELMGLFVDPIIMKLAFAFFAYATLGHWIGCMWYIAGRSGTANDTWIKNCQSNWDGCTPAGMDTSTLDNQHAFWYIKSLYWALGLLSTTGYGDIKPTTLLETMLAMIVQIASPSLHAVLVGALSSWIRSKDAATVQYQLVIDRLDFWMSHREVPSIMKDRVYAYYDYLWIRRRGVDEITILNDIPFNLRNDIIYNRNFEVLQRVPIFRDCGIGFLGSLSMRLMPQIFPPNNKVVVAGEVGEEMYLINNGNLRIVDPVKNTTIKVLSKGQYFGELAMVLGNKRTMTIICIDFCELFVLERVDLEIVLLCYPDYSFVFEERAGKNAGGKPKKPASSPTGGPPSSSPTASPTASPTSCSPSFLP
jgi:CRP-like cAMP-binding protein